MNEKRFYIQNENKDSVKLLHAHEINEDSQHLYLPCLKQSDCRVLKKHETRVVSLEDVKNLKYKWNEFKNVPNTPILKYVSFHPKEMCFRLELEGNIPAIEIRRDDDDLGDFIDFILISDEFEVYENKTIKGDFHLTEIKKGKNAAIRGGYSIGNKDLRNHPWYGTKISETTYSESRPVQMFISEPEIIDINPQGSQLRPAGTVLTLLFSQKDGNFLDTSYIIG